MFKIFVDADGCPVKQEVYRVAERYGIEVILVANSWLNTPKAACIRLEIVKSQFDAADDWIIEHICENDIVVTADIPLASRALEKNARALDPRGHIFDEDNIGEALATRELKKQLRDMGIMTGGPAPFKKQDRSKFLQNLDQIIRKIQCNLAE